MKINVHIERLILEEVLVARSETAQVQSAVAAQLRVLLAKQGLRPNAGSVSPHVITPSIELSRRTSPARTGERIACAIHSSLLRIGGASQ